MLDMHSARRQMIDQQVRTWNVLDEAVLNVMAAVPREAFVPVAYRELAYADTAVPLAHGQSMLPPGVDGRILQSLDVRPTDNALEIGTGSGFFAACLAQLAAQVRTVEIYPDLAAGAASAIATMNLHNVSVDVADAMSCDAEAAYDVIALTGSLPIYDARFERALKPGGRLFAVIGQGPAMTATLITRTHSGDCLRESLFETVLDPLIHAAGPSGFVF
jgi:protein-L-isoaspartate(D-aspartate) O-methyltransferase